MKEIVYYAAFSGFIFNFGRLVDIAWPTQFFPWKVYAVTAAAWFCVLVAFHP